MTLVDWIVVQSYAITMVSIGVWLARRNRTTDAYFIGDRNVRPLWAGLSLVATLVSSISYLAYPGQTISVGTGWLYQVFCFPIAYVVLSWWFLPYIMAVPVKSAYELLETRLGPSARLIAAGFFVALRISWLGLILYTCSDAMHTITGIDRGWLIVALAAVTIVYTTEGGILAVIWTDVAQFVVLLGGAAFVFFFFEGAQGPIELLTRLKAADRGTPWFSFTELSILGMVGWAGLWQIATCASDQVAMQRFFTTRDTGAARRTLLINFLGSTLVMLTLAGVGVALSDYYREHWSDLPPDLQDFDTSGDRLFPWVIAHVLPRGLTGLVVAAILSAAMSSLSSGIHSVTTVISVDFLRRRRSANSAGAESLSTTQVRLIAVGIGTLVTGLTFLVPLVGGNFFTAASRLLDPWTGPLFGLFVLAYFDRRATGASAALGVLCGVVAAYLVTYAKGIFGLADEIHFVFIMPTAVLATIAVGWLAAFLLPKRSP